MNARSEGVIGQLVRYGIVAGAGYLLAIGFYAGELDVGIAPYPALGVAFVLNGLFNFVLIRAWAFPPSGRSAKSDLGRFAAVAVLSLVVNYSSFALLYSLAHLHATTAQQLGILIAAPVTFSRTGCGRFRRVASFC